MKFKKKEHPLIYILTKLHTFVIIIFIKFFENICFDKLLTWGISNILILYFHSFEKKTSLERDFKSFSYILYVEDLLNKFVRVRTYWLFRFCWYMFCSLFAELHVDFSPFFFLVLITTAKSHINHYQNCLKYTRQLCIR